jgi:histidine triad (HIT) family protein
MNDCIFCNIIAGELQTTKIYEDGTVFAMLDIQPNNFGHTLVVPKEHYENLYTVPPQVLSDVMLAAQKIAGAIKNALATDGMNIAVNVERDGGQLIDHLHVHVIPRYKDDGFAHGRHLVYETGQKEAVAEKIRTALD